MRVFIPTKGRAETITTHRTLAGMNCTIVVHDQAEANRYRGNPTINPSQLIVAAAEPGLPAIRNWIINHLVEDGEWFVFADDNMRALWKVPEPEYSQPELAVKYGGSGIWRPIYEATCTAAEFEVVLEETRAEAEWIGTAHAGFSGTSNYYFRGKKWSHASLVWGKLTIQRKTVLRFDPDCAGMTDYDFTAAHMLEFGAVVVNNFAWPVATRYTPGGEGQYRDRLPLKVKACHRLMALYPGLYRFNPRRGEHPESEVLMRIHSPEQIAKWQAAMTYSEANLRWMRPA